ncbi:hypothetical protein [Leptothoe sp. PORK10 BA2]|uniref:hypothetical protein n=1 Tax=Leptothoe sp. PORK10 BA2 TaxID=3110254 RepID=UPI002B1F2704|nr:hypothetical protein [Leptothoe sp. PORK10 BA2]MEA5464531.1 hypothetical protein [Leptothoe sp. PORK10 BA2]
MASLFILAHVEAANRLTTLLDGQQFRLRSQPELRSPMPSVPCMPFLLVTAKLW